MKLLKVITICFLLLGSLSCNFMGKRVRGNGNMLTENRDVRNATRINLVGSVNVEIVQGPPSAKVQADENLMRYIIVEEEDGWLKIRTRDGYNLTSKNELKVSVSTPSLKNLMVTGSGNISTDNKFTSSDKITLKSAGSGDINIPVNTPELDVSIAGSGDVNVMGETKNTKVKIAGSGNFNGKELKTENSDISIAGSGNASIFSDVKLDARIVGSGSIVYGGNASVNKKITGSGSVNKAE